MANISPTQFRAKLQRLKDVLKEGRAKAELAAIKTLEADMKRRVFNDGKASDGTPLGPYRSRHRLKRQLAGRQVQYKDLEFEGDLRRSLTTGELDGHAVLGFTRDRERIIAEAQQGNRQTGKVIWQPSGDELQDMLDVLIDSLEDDIKKALA